MCVHYRYVKLTFSSHFHHVRALSKREIDILYSFPPRACTIETLNWHFSVISIMCVHYLDVKLMLLVFSLVPTPIPNSDLNKTQHLSKIFDNSRHLSPSLHFIALWMKSLKGGGGWLSIDMVREAKWCSKSCVKTQTHILQIWKISQMGGRAFDRQGSWC